MILEQRLLEISVTSEYSYAQVEKAYITIRRVYCALDIDYRTHN